MSETTSVPRPRQATTAAIMGGVASLLMVLSLFDLMAGLHSIEAREQIADKLATPTYQGLDVDAGLVNDMLRVLLLFNGAIAAAAVVFAVFVFQKHRGARLGFGLAAGLLFVGTFVLADWLPGVPFGIPVVLAFAASMMWSPPVRDWYAGRAPAPAPEPRQAPSRPATPSRDWAPPSAPPPEAAGPPTPQQPPPSAYPFGERRPVGSAVRTSADAGVPVAAGPLVDPLRRPGTVTAAIVLTWIVTPLVAFVFSTVVLMLLVARDTLLEAIRQAPNLDASGYTTEDLLAALWVACAMLLFWCLVASVLAFFAFRRQPWARLVLVGSAALAALVSLLAVPLGLLVAVPSAVTAGLLLSRSARTWYAAPAGPPPPPPYAGGGGLPTPHPQQYPPPPQAPSSKPPVW